MQTAHFRSTGISNTQPDVRREAQTQDRKAKHYIVTEQYQKSRESVNNCVLFVSQRLGIYH
jgi:hypothetical protein